MPQDWPAKTFDLIVLSEFGFYLSASELSTLISCVRTSLDRFGTVLACHWRHPIVGYPLNGDAVHALVNSQLMLARVAHHLERDLVIDIWCTDPRSVAQREALV